MGHESDTDREQARGDFSAMPLDVIACDRCGRRFATSDGPAMLATIKGPCPNCGGSFRLVDRSAEDSAPSPKSMALRASRGCRACRQVTSRPPPGRSA